MSNSSSSSSKSSADVNGRVWFLFLTALIVHLFDVSMRMRSSRFSLIDVGFLVLYFFVLPLIAYATLTDIEPAVRKKTIVVISLLSYFLPYANFLSAYVPAVLSLALGIFLMFTPMWIWYLCILYERRPLLLKIFGFLYLLFFLGILIVAFNEQLASAAIIVGSTVDNPTVQGLFPGKSLSDIWSDLGSRVSLVWQNAKLSYNDTTNAFSKQTSAALSNLQGDYYTGRVDSKSKERLGVFFTSVNLDRGSILENDPVTLYTTIQATTLDEPVTVVTSCDVTNVPAENIKIAGGGEKFTVSSSEIESVDCTVDKGVLDEGLKVAKVKADFNFKTLAYLKTYFMDVNNFRSYLQSKQDPLTENKIVDRNPKAVYTSGPVAVGMDFPSVPVATVDRKVGKDFSLGLTITNVNNPKGVIKNLKSVVVLLPKGFVLDSISGGVDKDFKKVNCVSIGEQKYGCDDRLFDIYTFSPPKDIGEIAEFVTFRLYLKLPSENVNSFLGNVPLTVANFKVMVDYDYELRQISTFSVKKGAPVIQDLAHDISIPANPPYKISYITDAPSRDFIEFWVKGHETQVRKTSQEPTAILAHIHELPSLVAKTTYVFVINHAYDVNGKTKIIKSNPQEFVTSTASSTSSSGAK